MSDAFRSSTARDDASSSASSPSDRLNGLLQRVALKDREAFAQLYAATSSKLYGTVLRILRHRGWTDDVVQDAYVRIWQKAGQFDAAKASSITWMVTIARNGAIDELRRHPARRVEREEALDDVASVEPTAQARLETEQDARRLHACLDELEKGRRDMVRLAYLDGWSRADLATHFDQPVNTVKTWLHRALKQLKGCLSS
ncbi:sigma-70 family RNA polymerase sigma factor [Halomonas sp. I1]|uniref:sigma-70 family RNA polymerase sigma factor n=1 Tax=Halomonas sp. I1 TaxID=393536 RepID=UPI0028DDA20D|nr:sigma-70 family RNA polymerase sigma factor [Halomonas sp. I1]MDT8893244.1 sigma-70 family RNA polymerase sigma factor [Halomonas sp. I1]